MFLRCTGIRDNMVSLHKYIYIHLCRHLKLGFCRVIRFPVLLVASNAAVGGPSTAATFAESLRLPQLVVPAAICGTLGYAIGTPIAFEAWTVSVANHSFKIVLERRSRCRLDV